MAGMGGGREQWRALTQLHPERLVAKAAKAGQHQDHDDDNQILVRCAKFVKAAKMINDFYRWLNDKHDCGTSTAHHTSKLLWTGAKHLRLVADDVTTWWHTNM